MRLLKGQSVPDIVVVGLIQAAVAGGGSWVLAAVTDNDELLAILIAILWIAAMGAGAYFLAARSRPTAAIGDGRDEVVANLEAAVASLQERLATAELDRDGARADRDRMAEDNAGLLQELNRYWGKNTEDDDHPDETVIERALRESLDLIGEGHTLRQRLEQPPYHFNGKYELKSEVVNWTNRAYHVDTDLDRSFRGHWLDLMQSVEYVSPTDSEKLLETFVAFLTEFEKWRQDLVRKTA